MATTRRQSGYDSGDFRYDPLTDPTRLTTAQLLREVSNLKELVETRLTGMDEAVKLLAIKSSSSPTIGEVVARMDTKFQCTDDELTTVENATHSFRDRIPLLIKDGVAINLALQEEKFASIEGLIEVRFDGIQTQFVERDKRTEQLSLADKTAVAAALQAQKESAASTNESNTIAINKMENNFAKLIDQTQALLQAVARNTDEKINDIKGRLDRGEGKITGAIDLRGATVAIIGAVLGLIVAGAAVYGALRPQPTPIAVPAVIENPRNPPQGNP